MNTPRMALALLATGLSACLTISPDEQLQRIVQARSIGSYTGTWTLTFTNGGVVLDCTGDLDMDASGDDPDAPLALSAQQATCTTDDGNGGVPGGLPRVDISGTLEGSLDGETSSGTFAGETDQGEDIGATWEGDIIHDSPWGLEGSFSGAANLPGVGNTTLSGGFLVDQIEHL